MRKFKSFVLRDSIDDSVKSREGLSVLESIEEYLDQSEIAEIVTHPMISEGLQAPQKSASSRRYGGQKQK